MVSFFQSSRDNVSALCLGSSPEALIRDSISPLSPIWERFFNNCLRGEENPVLRILKKHSVNDLPSFSSLGVIDIIALSTFGLGWKQFLETIWIILG